MDLPTRPLSSQRPVLRSGTARRLGVRPVRRELPEAPLASGEVSPALYRREVTARLIFTASPFLCLVVLTVCEALVQEWYSMAALAVLGVLLCPVVKKSEWKILLNRVEDRHLPSER
jgi:hypothetical protein